jgi:transcription elongation factor Elf1
MKTQKINKEFQAGECPVCGSRDLNYECSDTDGDNMWYPWSCGKCGSTGVEYYELKFIEHQIRQFGVVVS